MRIKIIPYVLTCVKTQERLAAFYKSWNAACCQFYAKYPVNTLDDFLVLKDVVEVMGMNSERFPRVPFWRDGNGLDRRGHTACYWGHVQEWRQALATLDVEFDSNCAIGCAFFEDDAILDADIWERVKIAVKELPNNWDIFYFGGEHCVHGRPRPAVYSENLFKVDNVNRTHAYMVNLRTLPKLILWFEEHWDWGHNFRDAKTGQSEAEIDYALGHLTETGFLQGFALRSWACGQGAGFSWTQGVREQYRRWELD